MVFHERIDPFDQVVQIDVVDSSLVSGNYTSDDASSVASEQPVVQKQTRRSRNTKADAIDFQSFSERLQCKSKRHAKRHTHLSMVRALVGLEESEVESELSWMPDDYGRSGFSSLFLESEKMKAWNSFIEMNEEDQLLMMAASEMSEQTSGKEGDVDGAALTFAPESKLGTDKRGVHPSYSSHACFQRIDPNIKNLLKKRHVPLGLLERIEIDVRGRFSQAPSSLFQMKMLNSFGRLLLHGVAQYLGLGSTTSFDESCTTSLCLTNSVADHFHAPAQLLSEYLEWKSGKH